MKRLIIIALLVAAFIGAGGPFSAARPAAAQGGSVWTAQFFNNLYLLGDPVATTQYGSLSLNWGGGSPAQGVNADNFTARISTDAFFEQGTYRFYIQADDAVQLWIDFPPSKQPQFSTFDAPRPGQMVTFDFQMSAGMHHIQFDFREFAGDAYLFASWANLASNPNAPTFPVYTSPSPVNTGPWTGQYYNNAFLAGAPAMTLSEASPAHNWGEGAPTAGFPADFFSVRWSSVQNLNTGTYQVSARADDGVRVFVDGVLLINEWHTASGQTYNAPFNVQSGQHTIIVEYYEATGVAALDFTLSGASVPQPQQPQPSSPTGVTATVIAYRLNVRNLPTAVGSTVLTKVNRNETYPVLGRNADGTWWEINVNGIIGWVSGRFISINNEGNVPVVDGSAPTAPQQPTQAPAPTGLVLQARVSLNIRSGPGTTNQIIGVLPVGQNAQILGRNAATSWWQINYNGTIGWVSNLYVTLQTGTNINTIPVTG